MLRIPLYLFDGACEGQRNKATRKWPAGIPLTEEAARWAGEECLDVLWGVRRLLTTTAWVTFMNARDVAESTYMAGTADARGRWLSNNVAADDDALWEAYQAAKRQHRQVYSTTLALKALELLRVPENRSFTAVETTDAQD